MQNFDDLDIEGRNPSHLLEEDKEKVNRGGGAEGQKRSITPSLSILHVIENRYNYASPDSSQNNCFMYLRFDILFFTKNWYTDHHDLQLFLKLAFAN